MGRKIGKKASKVMKAIQSRVRWQSSASFAQQYGPKWHKRFKQAAALEKYRTPMIMTLQDWARLFCRPETLDDKARKWSIYRLKDETDEQLKARLACRINEKHCDCSESALRKKIESALMKKFWRVKLTAKNIGSIQHEMIDVIATVIKTHAPVTMPMPEITVKICPDIGISIYLGMHEIEISAKV